MRSRRRLQLLCLAAVVLLAQCTSPGVDSDGEPEVRVRVLHAQSSVILTFDDEWELTAGDTTTLFQPGSGELTLSVEGGRCCAAWEGERRLFDVGSVELRCSERSGTLNIKDVPYGVGWWWEGKETRNYEGLVAIYPLPDGTLDVVVTLLLEDYLKGVVPYEIGPGSPLEALKAQAVAARSMAIVALASKAYGGAQHDLTSGVECQVFSGNRRRSEASDEAVEQTRSLILSEGGRAISAFYASSCGGHAELVENVWPSRPRTAVYRTAWRDDGGDSELELELSDEAGVRRWIESSPAVFCNPRLTAGLPASSRKSFRWERAFHVDELSELLAGDRDLGLLQEIRPLKRGVSGRIHLAEFVFERGSFRVERELAIRQLWAPSLRSSCFVVNRDGDRFVITGAGWGHGVGMCQSGAIGQALAGREFREILGSYYRGAELEPCY